MQYIVPPAPKAHRQDVGRHLASLAAALLLASPALAAGPAREYYQAPTWQPRAILPAAEALRGDFWPASPDVKVNYTDPTFDDARLDKAPAPGVHPRVLITPTDLDKIRAKVALGDKAPLTFRCMWERVKAGRGAFYALAAQDDTLGRELAAKYVKKMQGLEAKLDAMDKQPDRDNLWVVQRSMTAANDPNNPAEIADAADYDYLYQWLSPDERTLARRILTRITAQRISCFMTVPDHFMVNNHQAFGMEFMKLLLAIEGEEGFDQQVYDLAVKKIRAFLTWDLDPDGMCYETVKGWQNTSILYAVGRRERDLLRHGHLQAKMRFFRAALRWEGGKWLIRDEMRNSAFHVIWMMHYLHPSDPNMDLLYKASLSTHPFLTDTTSRDGSPVGVDNELLLLFADNGMADKNGKPLDWTDQKQIDQLNLPTTWTSNQRGYLYARNSWRKDDLTVTLACKQDFFYNGHEGSEHGRFTLAADGINWARDVNMLFNKSAIAQNMLSIDGRGAKWPPTPATWLGVQNTPAGVAGTGDYKDGYSYTKCSQIHPLDFPSGKLPYYAPLTTGNYTLTRDLQAPFQDQISRFYDGYAHTDYGPWSGETRLIEQYRNWNPMRRAFRTLQLTRGQYPYVLILDDAQKDDQLHQYDWNMTLPDDVCLVSSKITEFANQATEPVNGGISELILGKANTPRNAERTEFYQPIYAPKKGDPMLLVRVLNRNAEYGFPPPRVEQSGIFNRVVIPARSVSPDFRIMLFPHHNGDALPRTTWSNDRTRLAVEIGDQKDVYYFGTADAGRTVFAFERNGKMVQTSDATPARPVLKIRNDRFDANDLRYRRDADRAPVYLFDRDLSIAFEPTLNPTAQIHYTLDGSEPTASSPLYQAPISITKSAVLKASIIDPKWVCGPQASQTLTVNVEQRQPAAPAATAPGELQAGLLARVYEIKTVIWNDRGFFVGTKVMMPNVAAQTPLVTTTSNGFVIPLATPAQPLTMQTKGFYRFTGLFNAPRRGIYQFAVDSCGPVTLDVAGQTAIEVTRQYHLQQAVRKGEVALDAGWQAIELVVCDPLFWKINTDNPMPLSVSYRINGGDPTPVVANQLAYRPELGITAAPRPTPAVHQAITALPLLERGTELAVFERIGQRRQPDFFDTDKLIPRRQAMASEIAASSNSDLVNVYDGYFFAPADGVYSFDLPGRSDVKLTASDATFVTRSAFGEASTEAGAFQSQLRIGDEVVVQRGVPGRNPLRQVTLKAGYHPISIRLGETRPQALVTYPDGSNKLLAGDDLFRPARVSILPEGKTQPASAFEIFSPTLVTLTAPSSPDKLTIRYTLDGKDPTATSPTYDKPFTVDKTTSVTALAFNGDRSVTAPARIVFTQTDLPAAEMVCYLDFQSMNGNAFVSSATKECRAWATGKASLVEGRGGKVLSLGQAPDTGNNTNSSPGARPGGLRLVDIKLLENAATISLWVKTSATKGKLFGKDGFNAFGKSYKAVSCSLNGKSLSASPGTISGGNFQPNVWNHVVLTGGDSGMTLYLNGKVVATTPEPQDVASDALDFCADVPAQLSSLRIYNRILTGREIQQLFARETRP